MTQGYDFGTLYGMADHSVGTPLNETEHDAVVTAAEWGRTKDGTKGAWTIKFKTTTGERPGYQLTMTLSVNPTKSDGEPNPQGMGIMFRQLAAMGVPVPPPHGAPGTQGFWELGWTPEQVAQYIVGKPVYLRTYTDTYNDRARTKVGDIMPPRPGAPTQVQLPQQPQGQYAPQQFQGGYGAPGPANQGYAPGPAPVGQPNGYPQQPAGQPGYGYPGQQQPVQPQGPVAPGPWQNAQPQAAGPQPPQQPQAPQQPQQVPGVPPWAQPPVPGQGGMGEFTAQGQSFQGYPGQAPPQQPPAPQNWQPQQPQQGGQNVPPAPGYGAPAQGAPAPAAPSQQGAPSPSEQQPQQAPQLPPWAQ